MKLHIRELHVCEQLTSNDHTYRDGMDIVLDLSESNDDDLVFFFQAMKVHHRKRSFSVCCMHGTLSVRGALSLASVLRECPGVNHISFARARIEEFSAIAFVIHRRLQHPTGLSFISCFLSWSVMVGLHVILGSEAPCSLRMQSCIRSVRGATVDLSGVVKNNGSISELTAISSSTMKLYIRELCEQITSNDHTDKIDDDDVEEAIDLVLDFSQSNDDDLEIVFQAMKAHHRKRSFSVCCKRGTLSVRSALSLASVLRECPGVKRLYFGWVRIEEFSEIAFVIQSRHRDSTDLDFVSCLSPSVMAGLRVILGSEALCSLCMESCLYKYNPAAHGERGETVDLSGALRNNRSLRTLTIKSDSSPRMMVSSATFRDIARMLRTNQGIHSLTLSGIDIPANLLSSISFAAEGHSSLRTLDMNGSQFDFSPIPSVAEMLRYTPTLQKLDLSGCSLSNFPLHELALGLGSIGCSLTHLDISGNRISDGARDIRSILEMNQTILTLNLSANQIGPPGAESIAIGLRSNFSLRKLSFDRNPIGDVGATHISQMLTTNHSLHSIEVGGFGKEGFEAFVTNLPNMSGLESLSFYYVVADLSIDLGYAFVESLELNTSLREVSVRGADKRFRSEVIPKMVHLLQLNRGGRRILKSPTPVPAALWPRVLGRASRNKAAIYHFLRQKPDVLFGNGRAGKRRRDDDDDDPSPGTGRRRTDTGMQSVSVAGRPPTIPPPNEGFYAQLHSVAPEDDFLSFGAYARTRTLPFRSLGTGRRHTDTGMQSVSVAGRPPPNERFYAQLHSVAPEDDSLSFWRRRSNTNIAF